MTLIPNSKVSKKNERMMTKVSNENYELNAFVDANSCYGYVPNKVSCVHLLVSVSGC